MWITVCKSFNNVCIQFWSYNLNVQNAYRQGNRSSQEKSDEQEEKRIRVDWVTGVSGDIIKICGVEGYTI